MNGQRIFVVGAVYECWRKRARESARLSHRGLGIDGLRISAQGLKSATTR